MTLDGTVAARSRCQASWPGKLRRGPWPSSPALAGVRLVPGRKLGMQAATLSPEAAGAWCVRVGLAACLATITSLAEVVERHSDIAHVLYLSARGPSDDGIPVAR